MEHISSKRLYERKTEISEFYSRDDDFDRLPVNYYCDIITEGNQRVQSFGVQNDRFDAGFA